MLHRTLFTFALALSLFLIHGVSTAIAHPGGPAISVGSNPVRTASGEIDLESTSTAVGVISAPEGQDLVLTDIILGVATENRGASVSGTIILEDSSGTRLAGYAVRSGATGDTYSVGISTQFAGPTGVLVPAGTTVTIRWTKLTGDWGRYFNIMYTLSGYLVQP